MAVNFYAAIPLMAVLAIIQTAILPRFPIAGVEPQLLFLVALAWGLLRGLDEGLVWAFIAGIWVDLFSLTPVGLSSLAFMAGVAAPILLQPMLPPRRLPVTALLAALGTLIYLLLYVIALGLAQLFDGARLLLHLDLQGGDLFAGGGQVARPGDDVAGSVGAGRCPVGDGRQGIAHEAQYLSLIHI